MSNLGEDAATWDSSRLIPPERPVWERILTWLVRAVARLWVVCLLLVAGAVAAILVYELNQTQARLAEVREMPGAGPYTVVAYRRELARQIEELRRSDLTYDALPTPPEKSRLLMEIDRLRQQNQEMRANDAARAAAAAAARRQRDGRPVRNGPGAPS